jgi:hypothetical protein
VSYTRRRFLAASGALALASCGGGGSGSSYIGGPPAVYRPGILYGYYGDDAQQAAETADHCNLYMSAPWNGAAGAITNIANAKAAGFKSLLVMPQAQRFDGVAWKWGSVEQTLDAINAYMATLQGAGSLDGIDLAGLYWCDEPNRVNVLTDEYVRAVNVGLRSITSVPLWVTYSNDADRPGLAPGSDPKGAFDRVSVDNYDIGCNVLGGPLDDLKRQMKPGAKRFLVPGPVGGKLSQVDPACFENFAYVNADVIAVLTFIWIEAFGNNPANHGLRTLKDLQATYRALGRRITGR